MTERRPTANGVAAAAERIAGTRDSNALAAAGSMAGARLWVKAECLQQGGSFKLRGATNRLLQLDAAERARGVVAFSSGNHAQGVAIAAQRLGIAATIVMPADAPAVNWSDPRRRGGIIARPGHGKPRGDRRAARRGARATLVPSFDDVDVIEGQGSGGLEIAEQLGAPRRS